MIATILSLLFLVLPLAQGGSSPESGDARQLIDNERVTVWEAIWEPGKPIPIHQHRYDTVGIELADPNMDIAVPQGTVANASPGLGRAFYLRKGAVHAEGGSNGTRRLILVELKDVVVTPLVNTSGYPDAFPREGVKKLLDNDRVTVWDYTWTPGKPTVTHFHSKDVVVVYLENGDLSSTTPDGQTVVNSYSFGQTKFNRRDRIHSELLVKGRARVIAVELK